MKTALLAWEMGGADSAARLGMVAARLAARGWRIAFVLRDLAAADILPTIDAPRFQAPVWTRPMPRAERPFGPAGYGDTLAIYGYADPECLAAVLAGWDALFALLRPDIVVADAAPTACLAALGAMPVVPIGDGFGLPPAHLATYPPLHPHLPPLVAEARLLETIAAVQTRRGRAPLAALPALLASPFRVLCCVPPLDPYTDVRAEPALGPLGPRPAPAPLPIEPGLLAAFDLDADDAVATLDALLTLEVPAATLVRGAKGSLGRLAVAALVSRPQGSVAHFLAQRGIVPVAMPDIADAARRATIVAHRGDPAIAEAALLAGRPQILIPRTLDQRIVARMLEAMQAALVVAGENPEARLGEAVARLSTDQTWRDRALFWARRLSADHAADPLETILAACARAA